MELDIDIKLRKDFKDNYAYPKNLIQNFEENHSLSSRVSRCIVYLSNGNLEKLKSNIKIAEEDWRDILDEVSETNIDFKKPFSNIPDSADF